MSTREVAAAQNSSWKMIELGALGPAAGQSSQTSVSLAAIEQCGAEERVGRGEGERRGLLKRLSVKGKADKVQ